MPLSTPRRGSDDHYPSCSQSEHNHRLSRATVQYMNRVELSLPTPEWVATARYGVRPAPGGLALVQDFLNTRGDAATGMDLLGTARQANGWAVGAVRAWNIRRGVVTQPPTMTEHDAAELRSMRDYLDGVVAGRGPESGVRAPTDAQFVTALGGHPYWAPAGHGWRWFDSAICGEVLVSQQTTIWRRIKQCRNVNCRATMYDSTWDNSAVWHNRSTCDRSYGSPYPFHRDDRLSCR